MAEPVVADPHPASPREVKAHLDAARRGVPFLAYRGEDGALVTLELDGGVSPVTVGRRPDSDVALAWDAEVSRLHAELEAVGHSWVLVDDGLSRNGSYVNGARISGRRRLRDGDRLCFGETPVLFHAPGEGRSLPTTGRSTGQGDVLLSEAQRKVLVSLCRPLGASAYASPATNREISAEVHLSVDAVKAHLRVLFERFGLDALPQNQKRARLAALALVNGVVRQHEL
jgi:pSer/pThr/pTyr-binding forkhead associated (FHA) protein